jgi:hypothetical protein
MDFPRARVHQAKTVGIKLEMEERAFSAGDFDWPDNED